jgi:hypothetical protein
VTAIHVTAVPVSAVTATHVTAVHVPAIHVTAVPVPAIHVTAVPVPAIHVTAVPVHVIHVTAVPVPATHVTAVPVSAVTAIHATVVPVLVVIFQSGCVALAPDLIAVEKSHAAESVAIFHLLHAQIALAAYGDAHVLNVQRYALAAVVQKSVVTLAIYVTSIFKQSHQKLCSPTCHFILNAV